MHTAGRMHRISLHMHTAGRIHSIGHRSLVLTYQALYRQKDLINLLIDMVIRLFRPTVLYHRHV